MNKRKEEINELIIELANMKKDKNRAEWIHFAIFGGITLIAIIVGITSIPVIGVSFGFIGLIYGLGIVIGSIPKEKEIRSAKKEIIKLKEEYRKYNEQDLIDLSTVYTKCAFCGYETPVQFKKCSHCGAVL